MEDAGLHLQAIDPRALAWAAPSSCRVAVISLHTSPLEQPGAGDSGGMNIYVRKVAAEMASRGVTSDIFTRRSSPQEPEVQQAAPGVRVVALPAGPPRPVHKERLPLLVGRFVEAVLRWAEAPYDLVHAHYWLSGVAGARLKERWGVPLVVSFHTLARVKESAGDHPEPLFRTFGEERVVAEADRIVASTEVEREQLVQLYRAERSRVHVVPPGVDLELFRPGDREAARERLGLPDRPTVVFVGRLQPLKGAHVALGAMARLKPLVPDARLVIVGGDSPRGRVGERMRLVLAARRLRVARRVRFLEPLPHDQLAEVYRAADAVVIPSASESFGLVALEAAACGTPVVATDVGGLRRVVRDGQTGYLVPRRPAAFAHALSRVLTDRQTRERLGAGGVLLAREFPWSRTVDGLLRTYASVTACPSVTRSLAGAH